MRKPDSSKFVLTALLSLAVLTATTARAGDAAENSSPAPSPSPGEAIEVSLQNGLLLVQRGRDRLASLEMPCSASELTRSGSRVYAACGEAGVAVFDLTDPKVPVLEMVTPAAGAVVGFIDTGDMLWVRVRREEAHPFVGGPRPPAPASGTVHATRWEPRKDGAPDIRDVDMTGGRSVEARIVAYRAGEATIDAGREHGLRDGDRVEVLASRQVALPAIPGERPVMTEVRERVAVATIAATSDDRALLRFGVGERAGPGDLVVSTSLPASESLLAPPRLGGLGEVAFAFRPFLVLDTLGVGSVNEASLTWRSEAPWYARIRLQPLGVAVAEEATNLVTVASSVGGGYDTRYFGLGLGFGMSSLNAEPGSGSRPAYYAEEGLSGRPYVPRFQGVHNKFGVSQEARLGARDGLHLDVYNTFIRYGGAFRYGGTTVSLSAPVTSRTTVIAGGGGGLAGFGYGELGVRSWVMGNGDAGSLALGTSAGWGYLFGEIPADEDAPEESPRSRDRSVDLTGPILSVHGIWRFGAH